MKTEKRMKKIKTEQVLEELWDIPKGTIGITR